MNATRETCYVSNAGTNMSFPQRDRRTDRQCSCWDSGPVVAGGVTTTQGAQETGRQGRRGLDIWAERMSHGQHYAVITSLKVVAAKMQKQPDWNAGCAERVRRVTHRWNCHQRWPEFRAHDSEANN